MDLLLVQTVLFTRLSRRKEGRVPICVSHVGNAHQERVEWDAVGVCGFKGFMARQGTASAGRRAVRGVRYTAVL